MKYTYVQNEGTPLLCVLPVIQSKIPDDFRKEHMVCLIFFILFCSSKKPSYQMFTTNFASIFLFVKAFCIQINFTCSMFFIVSFANRQKIARALGLIHNTVYSPICKKKEAKYNLIQLFPATVSESLCSALSATAHSRSYFSFFSNQKIPLPQSFAQ